MIKYEDIIRQMEHEMDRMTQDALKIMDRTRSRARIWQPRADVCETEEAIIVTVELAGLSSEAASRRIEVTLTPDNRALVVSGKREEDCQSARVRCFQLEIYYGAFERTILLPSDVSIERDSLSATYRDGFLRIVLPKREPEEPRSIPVTAGESVPG
jgi:HSP20 family protein